MLAAMNRAESSRYVAVYRRLLESWNSRDAKSYAALFTPAAHVTGFDGSQMNGQSEIASELAAVFEDHPTASYVGKVREVRPLGGRDAVLLRAVVGMIPPGKQAINPAANAIQNLVLVDDPSFGEPRIDFFQNTPAEFHGRPELGSALTEELTLVLQSGRLVHAEAAT